MHCSAAQRIREIPRFPSKILYFVSDIASKVNAASSKGDMDVSSMASAYIVGDIEQPIWISLTLLGDAMVTLSQILRRAKPITRIHGRNWRRIDDRGYYWVLSGSALAAGTGELSILDVRIQEFSMKVWGRSAGRTVVTSDLDGGTAKASSLRQPYDATTGTAVEGSTFISRRPGDGNPAEPNARQSSDATPPACKLSAHLGSEVWIKRDDLTGFGLRGIRFANWTYYWPMHVGEVQTLSLRPVV